MANQIVNSNFLTNNRAVSAQGLLNTASRLRLYKTAITPSPADTLATYTGHECDFDTYSIQTLTGGWATPVKIIDGEYQTLSGVSTYSSPATTGNTIYGAFVDDNAGNLLFAFEFDTAIAFTVGAPELQLQIAYQVWAKSIVP